MAGAFARSWETAKLSFGVIKKDKELLLFPILAGIFSILFMAAMLFPTLIASFMEGAGIDSYGALEYVIIFTVYFGLAFIATFFNVCVVYTTKKRFEGGNATFGESIKYSFSKIHLIFSWSLLAATVGLILRIIDKMAEKAGQAGQIVLRILNGIFGMVWSIITIFVVPSMVYNDLGPIDAIKRSVQVLKKTWGESLIRYFGLGLIQFLFYILGVVIAIPLIILLSKIGIYGIVAGILITILYFITVTIVFGIANTVFNTALYFYADSGKIPTGYSQEIMSNAFKQRTTGIGRGI